MTTWELPHGYGRAGIDVVTYGEFWGKAPRGGCQHQWGTSVACPVVVGVLALLLSELPPARRALLLNPAAIKQVLVEAAEPMPRISHMEQALARTLARTLALTLAIALTLTLALSTWSRVWESSGRYRAAAIYLPYISPISPPGYGRAPAAADRRGDAPL